MSRRLLIVAGILAALLALYALVGFLVVPGVAKDQIESRLAEQLGIEAHLESLSFDPFRLDLTARGFHMGETGFREFEIDLEAVALLSRALVVSQVRLVGATIEMRVGEDGSFRIAGIGLGGADDDEPAAPDTGDEGKSSPLSALEVRSLRISDGRLLWVDASRTPPFQRELGPIDLEVEGLRLTHLLGSDAGEGEASEVDLTIVLGEGALFSAKGKIDLEPMQVDLALSLEGLLLSSFQPYVATVGRLELRDGVLGAEGQLRYGEGLSYTGSLGVSGLEVGEPDVEAPMLAWQSLDVTGIEVTDGPWKLAIGGVDLAEPRARLVQGPEGSNVARAFAREQKSAGKGDEKDGEPRAESEPIEVVLGPVHLANGSVRFEDRSVEPAYRAELQELDVRTDRFSTKGGRTQLDLSAQLDGYAPVAVSGSLEPLDFESFLDLTASARSVELSSFSSYSGRYVGSEIEGGRGSLDIHAKIDGGHVVGENAVLLEGLDFGRSVASPDATSLPVPAAATLLANANGEIHLDLPVEGDLDDPNFSYWGALLDTVRTLITRVVQTPFKIVGGMVSLGGHLFPPQELGAVTFEAGTAELSEGEAAKLTAIAQGMAAERKLEVDVTGGADPARDGDVDLRVLARQRANAVRQGLEAAGLPGDRIHVGEIELGAGRVSARLRVR